MKNTVSRVYFKKQATEPDLVVQLSKLRQDTTKSVLILIASDADVQISCIPMLNQQFPFSIFACIAPGVIYDNQYSYNGFILISFSQPLHTLLIKDLSQSKNIVESAIDQFINENGESGASVVFIDGLSQHVEQFIRSLYEQLGAQRSVIGGGLGASDFVSKACIADENGCYSDAALVFSISNEMQLPMVGAHGWEEIAGPFLITQANNNQVIELNYRPAFEIYQEAMLEYNGVVVTKDNFSIVSRSFPFGLKQLESDYLVRDPARLDNNTLFCVGNVEENSLVYILHSNKSGLISAAETAARKMAGILESNHQNSGETKNVIAFDCISRALFLEDDFQAELNVLKHELRDYNHIVGLLSIGEIKNTHQGNIQLLNKTLVLGGM